MSIDWRRLRAMSTPEIVRTQAVSAGSGSGVLWAGDGEHELSALGALAWEGRDGKPPGPRYEWAGLNLLCNAAPTPFVLDAERFHSIDSFYEALKMPEGSEERGACAMAHRPEAQRLARRYRAQTFSRHGVSIAVGSPEHEAVLAAAICAKLDQHPEVQQALRTTGQLRLVFPGTSASRRGALARVTPLVLMIERWRRFATS